MMRIKQTNMNAYDKFMVNEIMPAINQALKKEDQTFRKKIENSNHPNFYNLEIANLSSSLFTERTIQYLVFRDLCSQFKIWPEHFAYKNSNKRIDLAIYKNIEDWENKIAEIGIEIKLIGFTLENKIRGNSVDVIIEDFDKIKKAENPNKYLLVLGMTTAMLNIEDLNDQFITELDNRMFKKFRLQTICIESFKVKPQNEYNRMNAVLIKLQEFK